MDGRSMGVDDALPGYASSHTAVFHIHAHDLIGVAVESVAAGVTLVRVRGEVDLLTAPLLRGELDYQLDVFTLCLSFRPSAVRSTPRRVPVPFPVSSLRAWIHR